MNKVEKIKKIFKENECQVIGSLPYNERFYSRIDAKKHLEEKMVRDIAEFAYEKGHIDFSHAFEEHELYMRARVIILHPDMADRIIQMLENKNDDDIR